MYSFADKESGQGEAPTLHPDNGSLTLTLPSAAPAMVDRGTSPYDAVRHISYGSERPTEGVTTPVTASDT